MIVWASPSEYRSPRIPQVDCISPSLDASWSLSPMFLFGSFLQPGILRPVRHLGFSGYRRGERRNPCYVNKAHARLTLPLPAPAHPESQLQYAMEHNRDSDRYSLVSHSASPVHDIV